MSSAIERQVGLVLLLCAFAGARAQTAVHADSLVSATATHVATMPRVPGMTTFWHGLNAGVTFAGVHDSSLGWYTVATPAASYTISPHYSADINFSIYPSRVVEKQDRIALRRRSVLDIGDIGDVFVGLHASFNPRQFSNITTASFTFPTGNRSAGLSAGKPTFDFSDHVERYHGQTGLLLDLGVGNSSGLFNRLLTNDYTTVGTLVHFQGGMVMWVLGSNYVQSVIYEQHPVGHQTLYSTSGTQGAPGFAFFSKANIGEDHGITTSVGIPLSDHLTLSGYYGRSFSQSLDTVSLGMTYVLRGTPRIRRFSMIDRALREAEREIEDQGSQSQRDQD